MRTILDMLHLDPGEESDVQFNMSIWSSKERDGLEIRFENLQNTYSLHTYRKLEERIFKKESKL